METKQNIKKGDRILRPCLQKNLKSFQKEAPAAEKFLFTAAKGEVYLTIQDGLPIYWLGLGDVKNDASVQQILIKGVNTIMKSYSGGLAIQYEASWSNDLFYHVLLGAELGTYSTDRKKKRFVYLFEKKSLSGTLSKVLRKAAIVFEAQTQAMDWLNKPANAKRSDEFGKAVAKLAKSNGIECAILDRKQCAKKGLDAFLAVNQASAYEPAFIILKYSPKKGKKGSKKLGLVGKCVTFDTGGISIKGSQNLHYMKSDMGGACAVLGTMLAIARLGSAHEVIAIMPATDNAVNQNAYLPSDVINSHSKKTIEVIDTDAEGRMTLADGLSYMAKTYKPDHLIDIATLTGSSVRTFGYACGALMGNDDKLMQTLKESGDNVSQKVWQLPLFEEYKSNLDSDVADIKNYSGRPITGAIDAAMFLKEFIHDHPSWAHLDIAGVAFGNVAYAKDKAATGYGVQLLLECIEQL